MGKGRSVYLLGPWQPQQTACEHDVCNLAAICNGHVWTGGCKNVLQSVRTTGAHAYTTTTTTTTATIITSGPSHSQLTTSGADLQINPLHVSGASQKDTTVKMKRGAVRWHMWYEMKQTMKKVSILEVLCCCCCLLWTLDDEARNAKLQDRAVMSRWP